MNAEKAIEDAIEDAHETMRVHLPADGHWCDVCGERHPCTRRRDARSLLIRTGRLVLVGTIGRRAR
ncbi:hypothetical protein AB0J86_36455 [Micromonospora sp. NPDC049559]|uniref:hypothetical protein n=1 Tax=Micromonospora sp. NPDC049559 TaxID=3155923 RepID=UPI0034182E5B